MQEQNTLAWHETLELHELVAFNSIGLIKIKMGLSKITDNKLKNIYQKSILELETSLNELLMFYPFAPKPGNSSDYRIDNGFFAGDLLAFKKTAVRNYSVAITETATPQLRSILKKQLNLAIDGHAEIFNYLYSKGMYPSYDMDQLLQHDVDLASKAISM
jgi:spore coat protein F